MTSPSPAGAFARDLIATWLDVVESVALSGYVAVASADEIPVQALADSRAWCRRFFTGEANPHAQDRPVRHAFHVASGSDFDLIRHDLSLWEVVPPPRSPVEVPVEIVEGRAFALVRVLRPLAPILDLNPERRPLAIEHLARRLLNVRGDANLPLFRYPDPIVEGSLFSTAPDAHPMSLASWDARVDGGVRRGTPWFLCYKRVPQLLGFPTGSEWFDDAFRASRTARPPP